MGAFPRDIVEALDSPAQPLEPATRALMELRLGHSFGAVRIHSNQKAAESARKRGARAYTVGANIVFAANQYAPRNDDGGRLLAHELAHVLQQRAGVRPDDSLGRKHDAHEDEAEAIAKGAAYGGCVNVCRTRDALKGMAPRVQYDLIDENDHDQQRADQEMTLRQVYALYGTDGIISISLALDRELMSGALGPQMVLARARTLIMLYEILRERFQGSDGSEAEQGDARAEESSPLAGVIEDIPPFGNVDLWISMIHETSSVRHTRIRIRHPEVPPLPESLPRDGFSTEGRGNIEADRAAAEIREHVRRPQAPGGDSVVGDIFLRVLGFLANRVALGLSGPITLIQQAISITRGMDRTEVAVRDATRAAGARCAVRYIAAYFNPPPRVLRERQVEARCFGDREWHARWNGVYPLDPVDAMRALRSGLGSVVSLFNEAFRRAERTAEIDMQRSLGETESRQLRQAVYERLMRDLLPFI